MGLGGMISAPGAQAIGPIIIGCLSLVGRFRLQRIRALESAALEAQARDKK